MPTLLDVGEVEGSDLRAAARRSISPATRSRPSPPRREHDAGAGLGERGSAGTAEAAARAGDERPLAVETEGGCLGQRAFGRADQARFFPP